MADTVAEGRVVLRVDENVRAELAKAEAAFDRTMAKLDGKEAELRLNADTKEFYTKFRKAQEDLERWEHEKATAELDVDSRRANAGIANAKRRLQDYEKQNVKVVNRINNLDRDRAKAIADLANKREAGERRIARAAEDAAEKAARASEREAARREAASARVAKAAEQQAARAARAAEQQASREQRAADKTAQAAERAAQREVAAQEKVRGQTARLEKQYISLNERRARLERAQSRVFMPESDRQKIGIDIRGVDEQIAEVKAKLATIGHPPPEVDIHINTDNRGAQALTRWVDAISDTTVRLGPFTTTIAGAVRALALLGPIIMGIVGALGALTAAVGAAAAAAGGLALAGFGAFGLVLGSFVGLLPGLLTNFKNLTTLQTAYNKAVLKYGEGSKQAKEAQKQLNRAMKQVEPSTRAAVEGFGKLQTQYRSLAQQAQKPFMKTLNEGFKTGSQLMKQFGPEAVQSFRLVAHGADVAFKALRGPEARDIIGTLFDEGQRALPAFGRGLGNLATAAGRVAAAFSKMLPSLGGGFEKWTQRFSNFTKDQSKLSSFVNKTTDALRSLGHLAQSTGSFLGTFFSGGVGPGVDLINRMADGIDRITDKIRATPGGMSTFFGESVDTVTRLYNVLQPLASLFVEWATMMRPFSNVILSVTGAIAGLIDKMAGFGPTRALMTAAFGVFLAGSLVSRIRNVTQAVGSLVTAFGQLGAKQVALRTGSALTGGALANLGANAAGASRQVEQAATHPVVVPRRTTSIARGAEQGIIDYAAVGGAARSAAPEIAAAEAAMSRSARAANVLRTGLTGVGAVLGIADPLFGAAALAVGGLAAAFILIPKNGESARKTMDAAVKSAQASQQAYSADVSSLADLDEAHRRAAIAVRQAKTELDHAKKGTDQYKSAQLDLRYAQRQLSTSGAAWTTQVDKSRKAVDAHVKSTQALVKNFDKAHESETRLAKAQIAEGGPQAVQGQNKLNTLMAVRNKLQDQAAAALNKQAAFTDNVKRATAGMVPLLGQAEQSLGNLARLSKSSALKIALKFSAPSDVSKVAAQAANSLRAGVPTRVVTKIVADSSNAEQAIKRLQSARLTPKRLQIVASGGKEALSMIQQLTGRKVPKKEVSIVEKGGPAAIAVLQHILGIKIPQKLLPIAERGSAQVLSALASINGRRLNNKTFQTMMRDLASGKLNAVLSLINSIPASRSSTVTVTTVHNNVFKETHLVGGATKQLMGGYAGLASAAFASGGTTGKLRRVAGESFTMPSLTKTINRAFATASKNQTIKATGNKVTKPALLVGEKHQTEFVVTTDPAYRKRNKGILATAAQRLGMNVVPAAMGVTTTGGYTPSFHVDKPPRGPGRKPKTTKRGLVSNFKKKKYNRALKSSRDWAHYVSHLQTQQDDLEREISIRESQVNEPEELVVEVGRIKDPTTGADLGPQMAPNTAQIQAYQAQLASVLAAMNALVAVIQAIIVAIPKAINAIKIEDVYRATNEHNLNQAIDREKHVIANHKKGKQSKADKRIISRFEKKKSRDEGRLAHEKQERKNIHDDKKTLTAGLKDAGFDLREAFIARASTQADHDGIMGKASTEAAAQNAQTTGSGAGAGGGAGSAATGPTLAQQTGLADTERANILKQFGSNMMAVGKSVVRGVGDAAGGVQANPSALNPNAGAGTTDRQATGIMSGAVGSTGGVGSTGSLSKAFAGGAAAASALGAAGAGGAAAALGGAGTSTVQTTNITNNFAAPPPDSHTWVKGVEFELGATV